MYQNDFPAIPGLLNNPGIKITVRFEPHRNIGTKKYTHRLLCEHYVFYVLCGSKSYRRGFKVSFG